MTCNKCLKPIAVNAGEPWYTYGQNKRVYCTGCWVAMDIRQYQSVTESRHVTIAKEEQHDLNTKESTENKTV